MDNNNSFWEIPRKIKVQAKKIQQNNKKIQKWYRNLPYAYAYRWDVNWYNIGHNMYRVSGSSRANIVSLW